MIESNFLNLIGLGNFDIGYVLLGLVIVIVILLIMNIVHTATTCTKLPRITHLGA